MCVCVCRGLTTRANCEQYLLISTIFMWLSCTARTTPPLPPCPTPHTYTTHHTHFQTVAYKIPRAHTDTHIHAHKHHMTRWRGTIVQHHRTSWHRHTQFSFCTAFRGTTRVSLVLIFCGLHASTDTHKHTNPLWTCLQLWASVCMYVSGTTAVSVLWHEFIQTCETQRETPLLACWLVSFGVIELSVCSRQRHWQAINPLSLKRVRSNCWPPSLDVWRGHGLQESRVHRGGGIWPDFKLCSRFCIDQSQDKHSQLWFMS